MPALYGSVYTLKFELKKKGMPTFKVGGLRARYPDAHLVPKEEWTHIIGLPIPEDTTSLPQKVPDVQVKIETWEYGTVAQILHLGPYDQEYPTIERLHKFIEENGYEIAGMHEEEYLTRPEAKVPKTIFPRRTIIYSYFVQMVLCPLWRKERAQLNTLLGHNGSYLALQQVKMTLVVLS
jgi:hypothetical protein